MNVKKPWEQFVLQLTKRAASANLAIENTNGELLVVKANYKAYWSLPGGWIDAGESPRDAAVREVKEEIDLAVNPEDLEMAAMVNRRSPKGDTYLFVFRLVGQIDPATSFRLQASELDDYAWVSREAVRNKENGHKYNTAVKNWASPNPLTYIERVV